MEKILFADTFKSFSKALKIPSVVIDDPIFRLHYKFTGLALLFAGLLVSGYQFFGNPILCIQRDDIPEQLLNTFCWIEGTFTLPKAFSKAVGKEVIYPGVDTYKEGDQIVEHAYYQWVYFVLFFQALLFCLPYALWRSMESGKMKSLIQKLQNPVLTEEEKKTCYSGLANTFRGRRFEHQHYALRFLLCEVLNFVIVIIQIYFVDLFLGGQFTRYGVDVVKFANVEQQDRIDPMIRVFPRITKCTFHKYGSSGDVQRHDALCLLPLNILNEKIYIIMWFWLIILAVLGGVTLIYRLIILLSGRARYLLLSCVASLTSREDIRALLSNLSYGDWFVLYLLADNIDNLHFRQLALQLRDNKGVHWKSKGKEAFILDDVDQGSASKALLKEKDESEV